MDSVIQMYYITCKSIKRNTMIGRICITSALVAFLILDRFSTSPCTIIVVLHGYRESDDLRGENAI